MSQQPTVPDPNPILDGFHSAIDSLEQTAGEVSLYAQAAGAAVTSLAARADLAEQRADQLEAELAECRGEEPDPDPGEPTPTIFGASDGRWPIPGVTRLPATRAYLGAGSTRTDSRDLDEDTSWSGTGELSDAVKRTVGGGLIWLSFKQDRPADLDRLFRTTPTGLRLIVTYNHEPENDTPPDPEQYQRAWANVLEVAAKRRHVKTADCLLGHMTDAQNEPFYVAGADYCGFDRYNPGLGNAKRYADPVTVFARTLAFGRRKGKPIVYGETGTIAIGSDATGAGGDRAGRVAWARKTRAHLAAQPDVPVVLWWNAKRMSLAADAELAATWLGGGAR